MIVKFYENTHGKSPVLDEINALSKEDQVKILGCFENVQQLGFHSPRVDFRQIDGKLWEIKIKARSGGYRFFYVSIKRDILVLLHVLKKKTRKTPPKEIRVAMDRLKEVIKHETHYIE